MNRLDKTIGVKNYTLHFSVIKIVKIHFVYLVKFFLADNALVPQLVKLFLSFIAKMLRQYFFNFIKSLFGTVKSEHSKQILLSGGKNSWAALISNFRFLSLERLVFVFIFHDSLVF